LAIASAVYLFLLILLRSVIPEALTSTVTLLAFPLILLAMILAVDLSDRATLPSETFADQRARILRARDVRFLTRQVGVAAKASPAYFENILRGRLRDLLAEKVSLETGLEKDVVKRTLADERLGPRLLRDPRTYALLYYAPPPRAEERVRMLREIIDRIEAWKA
jgi:hypothetical protein